MRIALAITMWIALTLSGCTSGPAANSYQVTIPAANQSAVLNGTMLGDFMCVEPSPVAHANNASTGTAIGSPTVEEAITPSFGDAQVAAYVGPCGPIIQLLRDELYRLCEGYMNKVITRSEYDRLLRRDQEQTASLLPTEQFASCRDQ